MRRLRYQVACSLDGYIAGPNGEYDWITEEPTLDLEALYASFDTFVMGRATWETTQGSREMFAGKKVIVLSRTLRPEDCPGVELVASGAIERVRALKEEPGRDIWLFGGGDVFRQMLAAGLVDTVEPAVIPILLGGGIPMLPTPAERTRLRLRRHTAYPEGVVLLEYDVLNATA